MCIISFVFVFRLCLIIECVRADVRALAYVLDCRIERCYFVPVCFRLGGLFGCTCRWLKRINA
jgi:hypothetical protein